MQIKIMIQFDYSDISLGWVFVCSSTNAELQHQSAQEADWKLPVEAGRPRQDGAAVAGLSIRRRRRTFYGFFHIITTNNSIYKK